MAEQVYVVRGGTLSWKVKAASAPAAVRKVLAQIAPPSRRSISGTDLGRLAIDPSELSARLATTDEIDAFDDAIRMQANAARRATG